MVVTLAAVLAACGGGGGATDANAPSCPHPRVDSIPLAVRLPGRPPVGGPAICSIARYRAVLATAWPRAAVCNLVAAPLVLWAVKVTHGGHRRRAGGGELVPSWRRGTA